ncbi:hypothetical protein V8G54_036490 [Vigna mungo]|uniref:Uncharacterized protein n=1 Tax=Vigna mungo TaxID=3915 RepID=A0AAQ3MGV4_VIGMU
MFVFSICGIRVAGSRRLLNGISLSGKVKIERLVELLMDWNMSNRDYNCSEIAMDPSIMKLLEDDEDETMHSGVDVEAFQAALNRDIGGDVSASQFPGSDAGICQFHSSFSVQY